MAFAPTIVPFAAALYVLRQSEKIAASEIKELRSAAEANVKAAEATNKGLREAVEANLKGLREAAEANVKAAEATNKGLREAAEANVKGLREATDAKLDATNRILEAYTKILDQLASRQT
jgi:hypothetical protein